jgi:uncharacterized protein (UPF0276 family)
MAMNQTAATSPLKDRVGLGWRPELAAGIFAHLDRIDIVEVIADDYFDASRERLSMLRTLAAQAPITLHGVTAGLASTQPVEQRRLDAMARLAGSVAHESWSEHLAFVRAGDIEIGHLAAPPRNRRTLDGLLANLERARRTVGAAPAMENIATLIDPPGSEWDEAEWLLAFLGAQPHCPLLLDLHNVYANALNFGFDPYEFLARLPLERVGAIHIAGGIMLESDDPEERRLLDDHLHPVPDPVYELLSAVAARAPQRLTVLLERDGEYPPMPELLRELEQARAALAQGRTQQVQGIAAVENASDDPNASSPRTDGLGLRVSA